MNWFFLGLTLVSWIILIVSCNIDRSRYRNCYFFFGSLVLTLLTILTSLVQYWEMAIIFTLSIILLGLLIVPLFLVQNGIVMMKREGRSLSHMLSLIFGILIGLGEVATFVAILLPGTQIEMGTEGTVFVFSVLCMAFSLSVIYLSMSFLIFMLYCIFLQLIPRKRDFDYVIIHGAGLINGNKMTKLLSERVDKAIDIYQKDPTPPIMIPSGGKGGDETISEAEAMEQYLLDKGIPAEHIIKEDKSTTTMENLINSKKIIDSREGRKYTVLVTSNYHVYRALRYCRKIGLKCVGVGSHVAFYYWPSALIREYIAVHSEKKHLIILIIGWILWMIPVLLTFITSFM